MNKNKNIIIGIVVLLIIIIGIGFLLLNNNIFQSTENQPTSIPTRTPNITETTTSSPSPTPTASSNEPTNDPDETTSASVQIYLVSVGDGGESGPEFGCGDSIVSVDREVSSKTNQMEAAIGELISINPEEELDSNLYNAFSRSNLEVEDVTVENGTATVSLNGDFQVGGVCDNPRIEEQLNRTITQFSNVNNATFFINGENLENML